MSTQTSTKKAIDPEADPRGYLLSKGWEPFDALWYDPQKPKKATERKVKVMDRVLPGGNTEAVYQVEITPAALPVRIEEALSTQRARDAGEK